ncbi:peptide deformylase [Arthrobacter sp. NIO-1057]|uniref:peptide deformylase n=1 Tax=Arthrobacter sp. NIO-1057 TaxID=993071 RepID=UPI00071CD822|nr:peptide deformylase [Arthrobacter sp. NIO-1057]KSU67902.1 peptide deformylase [Arthrobacter sp. NIO-1057]SCB82553.1 peptide deformylase [Arthrobacter sp. NIO-1057]
MNTEYTDEQLIELVTSVLETADDNLVLPIVQLGHPVLRRQAIPYTGQLKQPLLEELLEAMRQTMYDAPGVGLAAPQIGIPLQIAVLEDLYPIPESIASEREREPLEYFEIFNPTYTAASERTAEFYEGCLSFEGFQGVVTRPADITATYNERDGASHTQSFSGWQARIVQHETDHLSGTVYIDKAKTRSLINETELWRHENMDVATAKKVLNF